MHAEDKNIEVRMVRGLPGFEDIYNYTLKTVPGNPWFYWLESQDGPSFLMTKPETFFPDYRVKVTKETLDEIGDIRDISVYLILTVPEDPTRMTANLMAPLLVNESQGLGCQVVLHDSGYTTRHPLFPQKTA